MTSLNLLKLIENEEKQTKQPEDLQSFIELFQIYLNEEFNIINWLETLSNGIESGQENFNSLIKVVYSSKVKKEEKVQVKNTFKKKILAQSNSFKL